MFYDFFDFDIISILLILVLFLFVGSGLGFAATLKSRGLERRLEHLEIALRQLQNAAAADGKTVTGEDRAAAEEQPPASEHVQEPPSPEEDIPEEPFPAEEEASAFPEAATPPETIVSRPRPSLEERLGARWTVWVGGLALVLGGIFLVRYSIEAGLLTPAARVSAGALLALLLVGAGEFLRRRSDSEAAAGRPYIPGVLTLAGTTTAFASIFAAHALYGLIGPSLAFILLAATALLTLAASVVHGPAIASYGLLASYIVPFLVSSDEPAVWPLVLYGLAVSAAAYGVARLRLWRWLAIAAAVGAVFWGHVVAYAADGAWDAGALAFYDLAAFAMAAFVFVASLYPRDHQAIPEKQDWLAAGILFLQAFLILYLLQENEFGGASLAVLLVVSASMILIGIEWPAAAAAALGSFLLMGLAYLSWDVPLSPRDLTMQLSETDRLAAAFANPSASLFPNMGFMLAAIGGGLGFWGAWRSTGRWALAASGVATPLAMLAIAYFRLAPFETSVVFGALSLVLAMLFMGALAFLDRRLATDALHREAALAAYAIGTVGAIAGSMTILLGDGWLPVGLGLLTAGIIWVHGKWRLVALPWVALGVALLTGFVIWRNPTIVHPLLLGSRPIFNALLYRYGVPALSFAWCAWTLARRDHDRGPVQQAFEAIAVFAGLTTFAVIIHHAMNGGRLYGEPDTLAEWSLHTLVFLAGSLAIRRVNLRAQSPVLSLAVTLLGLLGIFTTGVLHLVLLNPLFTGESIGTNVVFNILLLAYLLPAILLGLIVWQSGKDILPLYKRVAGWLAAALTFAWISLQVRAVFHRPTLDEGLTSNAEFYTYSVVWLIFGIALLLIGLFFNSRTVRLASSVFVLAAVAKVFVLDMAGLDGVWRALSFIGLGIALIGVGMLYQKLLRPAPPAEPETT